jgi:hypothetical protein
MVWWVAVGNLTNGCAAGSSELFLSHTPHLTSHSFKGQTNTVFYSLGTWGKFRLTDSVAIIIPLGLLHHQKFNSLFASVQSICVCTCIYTHIFTDHTTLINITCYKLIIMQFSLTSYNFIPLRSKHSPRHPVLKYPHSLIVRYQASHLNKMTGKISFVYFNFYAYRQQL